MKRIRRAAFLLMNLLFATQVFGAATIETKNIQIVKNMFADFAENMNLASIDTYYTKDFVLESNGEKFNYEQYKKVEADIYKTLKSLKVTSYDDIFSSGNKVVSRMSMKLVNKNGKVHEFQLIMIALIRDNKIAHIWEVTYPSWSDKV